MIPENGLASKAPLNHAEIDQHSNLFLEIVEQLGTSMFMLEGNLISMQSALSLIGRPNVREIRFINRAKTLMAQSLQKVRDEFHQFSVLLDDLSTWQNSFYDSIEKFWEYVDRVIDENESELREELHKEKMAYGVLERDEGWEDGRSCGEEDGYRRFMEDHDALINSAEILSGNMLHHCENYCPKFIQCRTLGERTIQCYEEPVCMFADYILEAKKLWNALEGARV